MFSMTSKLCRRISLFIAFQIIFFVPMAWPIDPFVLVDRESAWTSQKTIGKKVEFNVKNVIKKFGENE